MWMFGLYVALYFGVPAAAVLTALAFFWRSCANQHRQALESGEAGPEELKKLKIKRIALTIAVVIGGIFVAAVIVIAVLLSTAVAFM